MNKNYMVVGFIAVSGIVLATSVYFFQDFEQKTSVTENSVMPGAVTQESVTQVDEIAVKSSVDEIEIESEVEPEIVIDKVEDMHPPGIVEYVPHDLYDGPQTFWEVDESDQSNDPEVYALNVDPKMISNLQVGQTFDFYVPELNQTFQTDINVTKNSFNGTHIFKGEIIDGSFGENVSIVRGNNLTFVTVATLQGVYSASIDNLTGKTQLQSEASLNKRLHGDDGIAVEITEAVPPEA